MLIYSNGYVFKSKLRSIKQKNICFERNSNKGNNICLTNKINKTSHIRFFKDSILGLI